MTATASVPTLSAVTKRSRQRKRRGCSIVQNNATVSSPRNAIIAYVSPATIAVARPTWTINPVRAGGRNCGADESVNADMSISRCNSGRR